MDSTESERSRHDKPNGKLSESNNAWINIGQRIMSEVPVIRDAPILFFGFSSILLIIAVLLLWWLGILVPAYVSGSLQAQVNTLKTQVDALHGTADKQVVLEGVWPSLTSDQVDVLKSKLKGIQETELVISCDQVSCRPLAISLLEAFKSSGWPRTKASIGGIDQIGVEGVTIYPVDEMARQIKGAIESSAGLQVTLFGDERKPTEHSATFISIGQQPFKVN